VIARQYTAGEEKLSLQRRSALTLLIVDQERSVRTQFADLCLQVPDLHVVGEAESGSAAMDAARNLSPDVMLIDVSLPDMSGFEVLRGASNATRPLGIMTSQQPDWEVRAIEEGAVDYLVKPVSADRFEHAIGRVRQRYLLENAVAAQLTQAVLRKLGRPPKLLVGERQHRLYPLDIDTIEYIEADGNYVTIRTGNEEYISRDSIKRLSADLSSFGFVRINRSILLNIRAVRYAEPVGHGTLAFTLSSGTSLHSSRTYRDEISSVLPWHRCRAGADL
jgi:two-component system LytT family response regulator